MRRLSIGLVTFLFILSAFCFAAHAKPQVDNTIKVGMLLPLSGNYASIGADTRQGIEIALSELENSRIELVYGDSRTEPVQAINEFRRMVDSEQVYAVFAFRGPVGMAVNPLSKQKSIPLLGGVGNKHFAPQNDHAFQMWPPSDQEGQFVANKIKSLGGSDVALVTAQDDWTHAVSEGFRGELSRQSISLIFDEEVTPETQDFRSIIAQLRSLNPNFIFANVGLTQIGPLIRQLRESKVTAPIVSNFWINKPEVIAAIGNDMIEGVLFAEMSAELPGLQRELKRRFNSAPSGATISAYVATMFLGQAAEYLPAETTQDDYYAKMLELDVITTRNGDFPVKNRVVQFPLSLKVFRSGKVTSLRSRRDS